MKLIQRLAVHIDMHCAPKITTWISGGEPVQITTQKELGETKEQQCIAHDAAVAAAMVLWPEDPH